MPLELAYYDSRHSVSPVPLGDGSIALSIDGRIVLLTDEAHDTRVDQVLSGTTSENPTDPKLVAMFLPQALSGHFVTPMLIYEGDPDAHHKIATHANIPDEEYTLWVRLFAQYTAS